MVCNYQSNNGYTMIKYPRLFGPDNRAHTNRFLIKIS